MTDNTTLKYNEDLNNKIRDYYNISGRLNTLIITLSVIFGLGILAMIGLALYFTIKRKWIFAPYIRKSGPPGTIPNVK
jgi:hypothetical protein